jgi:arylsulfatase A
MKLAVKVTFCFLLIFLICQNTKAQKAAVNTRPNIIYILADDLGYGDISSFNPESKISTPNIDAIAAAGMSFTNAHASASVCTPSRYAIMTGQYNWRSRLKRGVLWTYDWPLIDKNRLTVGQFLKNNGYHTAIVGKWHLGWSWPIKAGQTVDTAHYSFRSDKQTLEREAKLDFSKPLQGGPLAAGFEYQYGIDIPSLPPFCYIDNGRIVGNINTQLVTTPHPHLVQAGWDSKLIMPTLMDKAMAYVRNEGHQKQPFFLYLALTVPHYPIAPTDEFKGKSKMGAYGDVVQEMDSYIGKLMQLLKDMKIDKNTLVIFTSDNGSVMDSGEGTAYGSGYHLYNHLSNYKFKGIKGDIWDGGHRIPFIARWPGIIPKGQNCTQAISLTDLFATCAGILNKPLPDSAADDSYNILPLLKGEQLNKPVRQSIIFHSSLGFFAIEKGKWKYIECNGSGGNLKNVYIKNDTKFDTPGQLYDMENDPEEKQNLYTQYPEVVEELSKLLNEQKKAGTRYKNVKANVD